MREAFLQPTRGGEGGGALAATKTLFAAVLTSESPAPRLPGDLRYPNSPTASPRCIFTLHYGLRGSSPQAVVRTADCFPALVRLRTVLRSSRPLRTGDPPPYFPDCFPVRDGCRTADRLRLRLPSTAAAHRLCSTGPTVRGDQRHVTGTSAHDGGNRATEPERLAFWRRALCMRHQRQSSYEPPVGTNKGGGTK